MHVIDFTDNPGLALPKSAYDYILSDIVLIRK